jgi:hypothetical protein
MYKIKHSVKPMIYTFNDIEREIKYDPKKIINPDIKSGQLKLFFSELQFFYLSNIKDLCKKYDKVNVLYIGSGKGYHIPLLMRELSFNNIYWYLYDPYGHCKRLNEMTDNITINNKLFLDEDIDFFKNKTPLLFISDIRTCKGSEPTTHELLNDYNLQNKILEELNPDYSLLKFRYPFPDDIIDDFESYKYPNGIIYLQCFHSGPSTELRLFIEKNNISFNNFSKSEAETFEKKMAFYNNICRQINKNDFKIAGYILKKSNLHMEEILSHVLLRYKNDIKLEIKYDKN